MPRRSTRSGTASLAITRSSTVMSAGPSGPRGRTCSSLAGRGPAEPQLTKASRSGTGADATRSPGHHELRVVHQPRPEECLARCEVEIPRPLKARVEALPADL